MRYLLDTNVLSELTQTRPDEDVLRWFADHQPVDLCTSTIVLGELRLGIEKREPGRRTRELDRWYRFRLPSLLQGGTLPVDSFVAEHYGRLRAAQFRAGLLRGELDTWILATASVHGLIMVTRNVLDFGGQGIEVINPWDLDGLKGLPGTERW